MTAQTVTVQGITSPNIVFSSQKQQNIDLSVFSETERWGHLIHEALSLRYGTLGHEWALLFELAVSTGHTQQRIDAFAINLWSSHQHERVAYEIKASRSDFLREIKDKKKRGRALAFSNRFYFITPPGMLRAVEIPVECGLQEVKPDLSIVTIVNAPVRDSLPPNWGLFAAIARLACKTNGKV